MRYIFLLLILIGTYTDNCLAQYAFDVKTTMEEKEDLQNFKQGLLNAISNSSWASLKERGEDYSVWLTDLQRVHISDSVLVSLVVEIRTASFFTRGEFLDNRRIWMKYHWDLAQKFSKEKFDESIFDNPEVTDFDEAAENLAAMIGLVSGASGALQISSLSGINLGKLVKSLSISFKRKPSPVEVMESLYLGEKALQAMEEMIKN